MNRYGEDLRRRLVFVVKIGTGTLISGILVGGCSLLNETYVISDDKLFFIEE